MTSNYLNAPATKLLATHCAVCARPLVDAKSVELGIGPDCRKKYGFDMACTDEVRARANRLVYLIALGTMSFNDLKDAIDGLRNIGFTKLAEIITDRKSAIVVKALGTNLLADVPYNEAALPALRRIGHSVRDPKTFKFVGWQVPATAKQALFNVMKTYYPGTIGVGPLGLFEVPAAQRS